MKKHINSKKDFVSQNMDAFPNADEDVLKFIARISSYAPMPLSFQRDGDCSGEEIVRECEQARRVIHNLFRNGYCWYFAHMIDMAFPELDGEVCWATPFGHFVYMCDGVPYDIEGVYNGEAEYFIPEHFLGDAIEDFMHVESKGFNATSENIQKIVDEYLASEEYKDYLKLEKFRREFFAKEKSREAKEETQCDCDEEENEIYM